MNNIFEILMEKGESETGNSVCEENYKRRTRENADRNSTGNEGV